MELNTNQFMFSKKRKLLVAEASELGMNSTPTNLEITSAHTGRTVGFHLDSISRDKENEVTSWNFASVLVPVKVIIYND